MVYGLSLLPTKTSCQLVQSFGRSPSLIKTFSQVFTISLVNPLFLLILVVIILSSVSLSFVMRNHLDLISWLLWPQAQVALSETCSQYVDMCDNE